MKWIKALKAGEQLTHAATWKNTQVAINAVVVLATVVLSFVDVGVDISEQDLVTAATALVAVVNIYFTGATSKKIGVK